MKTIPLSSVPSGAAIIDETLRVCVLTRRAHIEEHHIVTKQVDGFTCFLTNTVVEPVVSINKTIYVTNRNNQYPQTQHLLKLAPSDLQPWIIYNGEILPEWAYITFRVASLVDHERVGIIEIDSNDITLYDDNNYTEADYIKEIHGPIIAYKLGVKTNQLIKPGWIADFGEHIT